MLDIKSWLPSKNSIPQIFLRLRNHLESLLQKQIAGSHAKGITFSGSEDKLSANNETPGNSDFAGKGYTFLRNKILKHQWCPFK